MIDYNAIKKRYAALKFIFSHLSCVPFAMQNYQTHFNLIIKYRETGISLQEFVRLMKKENYKRSIEFFAKLYVDKNKPLLCVQHKRESEKRACFKSVTVVNYDFTHWVTSALNGLKIDIKAINPTIRIFYRYNNIIFIYLFIYLAAKRSVNIEKLFYA